MAPGRTRDVVFTYRYLRGAMIALLLMLLLSVGYQWWWETDHSCWLGSISAYYYTPARTVFVGSLCALGASLIAYKGHSPEEDVLLNFSGFMAFVVAMVPTVPDGRCGPNAYTQTPAEIATAVRNNIWSLVAVAVLAALVAAWLKRGAMTRDPSDRPTVRSVVVSAVCGLVLLAELTLFLVLRDRFIALSHGIAAGTMVAGVIAVMVFSALRAEERHQGTAGGTGASGTVYKRIYIAIAVALAVALGATVLAALTVRGFDHLILIAEVIIIVLFAAYWGVQTKELWDLREADGAEARSARSVAE
ncbi:hypothetical protein ASE25_20250 [Terrabacter sp. Root85]|uniref:hypothetical protein n=1 Tax=Terrabacter sp. Root85 TaxID=1736603 RepID=UPI0006FC5CBE|nr:hypothetical protein [Terrabacter sp. Root85]KRC85357.1 hypothetical protein ASE25_20250 [Terrabacter sp. Root85]